MSHDQCLCEGFIANWPKTLVTFRKFPFYVPVIIASEHVMLLYANLIMHMQKSTQ